MSLPLDDRTRFGLMTRLPTPALARKTVGLLDRLEFDSIWVGDHLAFTSPILDPFVQLSYAAALSLPAYRRLRRLSAADAPSGGGGEAGRIAWTIWRKAASCSASASAASFRPNGSLPACRMASAVRA